MESILATLTFDITVYIGRRLMSIWMGEAKIHELYTAGCGLYTCWVVLRAFSVLSNWIPQGWRAIADKVTEWVLLVSSQTIPFGLYVCCVCLQ